MSFLSFGRRLLVSWFRLRRLPSFPCGIPISLRFLLNSALFFSPSSNVLHLFIDLTRLGEGRSTRTSVHNTGQAIWGSSPVRPPTAPATQLQGHPISPISPQPQPAASGPSRVPTRPNPYSSLLSPIPAHYDTPTRKQVKSVTRAVGRREDGSCDFPLPFLNNVTLRGIGIEAEFTSAAIVTT